MESLSIQPFSGLIVVTRDHQKDRLTEIHTQGSQEQEVKFQDPIFRKFQDNFRTFFVGFTRLKTQKMHVFHMSVKSVERLSDICTYDSRFDIYVEDLEKSGNYIRQSPVN